ncbi:hypothetical protein ECH7EC4206_A5512 [Escherichia coli O157:H7 str. EC4206]|nr:hypothetical protein ECH7EC4206_A5512 [Escherichia coli O157:H7 str. EC4206]
MVAQLSGHYLQRNVAIAEMPAGFREHKRICAAHYRNGFISGDHLNEFITVFVTENITIAQQQTAWQQQSSLTSIVKGDFNTAFTRMSTGRVTLAVV